MNLNKPCELEDFKNPDLASLMETVFGPYMRTAQPSWPLGFEYRKPWEVGMSLLALQRHPPLQQDFVLGVGAGQEATIFELTNRFRWVFATDLYLAAGNWVEAPPQMLIAPESATSPIEFRPRRLVTQHMDGRNLRYEDETFDMVFSSSSIEHFGSWDDVARSAAEMGRVLKRGGLLTLSTEYRIRGPRGGRGVPGVLMFDMDELQKLIVAPSGCVPVDHLQETVSERTVASKVEYRDTLADSERMTKGAQVGWSKYPHVVLAHEDYLWTSYHLALRKPVI